MENDQQPERGPEISRQVRSRSEILRELDRERDFDRFPQLTRAAEQSRALAARRARRVQQIASGLQIPPALATAAEIAAEDQRAAHERIRKLLAWSGIPEHFRAARLDDVSALPADAAGTYRRLAVALARLLQPSPRPRLVIVTGPPGVGKTHACCGLLLDLIRGGAYARFDDARDFMDLARSAYNGTGSEDWRKMLDRYARARLVVIDELPAGITSDFARERIEQVLNKRYAANLDSVVTGNARPEAFRVAIGDRLSDRACEAGGVIEVGGESFRSRLAGTAGCG